MVTFALKASRLALRVSEAPATEKMAAKFLLSETTELTKHGYKCELMH